MAQMYFYKFNINSEIYDVYKDDSLQQKILEIVFAKIDSNLSYKVRSSEEEKGTEYKFCDLAKNADNMTITGRLVKIYDGETESYDRKKDTVKQIYEEDKAASATFYFDLRNEEIAFITRQGFGYKQFGTCFKTLLETVFPENAFELILEKNVGQLKEKIYIMNRVIKVNSVMVPPNANEDEFKTLLGATVDEFKDTKATKYVQGLEVSARGTNSINVKTKFFDRIFYAIGKGYAKLSVEGRNAFNEKITVDSDEDAPYKLPISEKEKDSIPAFMEKATVNINALLYNKSMMRLENSGDENNEDEGTQK